VSYMSESCHVCDIFSTHILPGGTLQHRADLEVKVLAGRSTVVCSQYMCVCVCVCVCACVRESVCVRERQSEREHAGEG